MGSVESTWAHLAHIAQPGTNCAAQVRQFCGRKPTHSNCGRERPETACGTRSVLTRRPRLPDVSHWGGVTTHLNSSGWGSAAFAGDDKPPEILSAMNGQPFVGAKPWAHQRQRRVRERRLYGEPPHAVAEAGLIRPRARRLRKSSIKGALSLLDRRSARASGRGIPARAQPTMPAKGPVD